MPRDYARVLALPGAEGDYWRRKLAGAEVARVAANPFRRAPAGRAGVGLVMPGLGSGGGELAVLQILESLDGRFAAVGTAGTFPFRQGPLPGRFAALAPIASGHDAVIALARTADVIVSWGCHDLDQWWPPGAGKLVLMAQGACEWTALAMRHHALAARTVLVSEYCRKAMPPGAAAIVVPNMADTARIVPRIGIEEQRGAWGVPGGLKVLLYLGRLSGEKRPHLAWEGCPEGWVAVCVGDGVGDVPAMYKARARGFPAIFAGPTEDVGSALAAADAVILPSETEGCSLAGLECHLAGRPLIATPVGLYAHRGSLVRLLPKDPTPAEVAAAIRADEADPLGTAHRCRLARAEVRALHSPEAYAANWNALLAEVCPPPPSPADTLARVAKCPHRGRVDRNPGCGCSKRDCSRFGRIVTYSECAECVNDAPPQ